MRVMLTLAPFAPFAPNSLTQYNIYEEDRNEDKWDTYIIIKKLIYKYRVRNDPHKWHYDEVLDTDIKICPQVQNSFFFLFFLKRTKRLVNIMSSKQP